MTTSPESNMTWCAKARKADRIKRAQEARYFGTLTPKPALNSAITVWGLYR